MFPAPEDAGSLRRGHITYLPVAPGRMEFALEVRRRILAGRPRVVAVELPTSLERHYLEAVRRLPQVSVLVYPRAGDGDDETGIYVPVEPADPFAEAVRTALEIGAEVLFCEPGLGERPHLPDVYPDPYALRRIPYDKYVEAYRLHPASRTDEIAAHAAGIAWRLQGSDPFAPLLAVISLNLLDPVLDAMEVPQDEPPRRHSSGPVDLVNADPECLAEITVEYPYLQERYERYRAYFSDEALVDRPRTQWALLKDAEAAYGKNTGDTIAHWQRRMMARYSRNLAIVNQDLTPSLFDITVAARSIVDDNYAWEVWEMANRYPFQTAASSLETVRISGEEVWIRTKRMKIRRRLPRPKQRLLPSSLKRRPKEAKPGEWAQQFDGNAICSYPPEDIVIESHAEALKQKAKNVLSEEHLRIEPFLASILDGIDVRETVRNWHQGNIYVRASRKVAGDVGAVVIIFDPDEQDRYPYRTTWLGEHQNESDMAFYATNPFEHLVGPGIGRGEYGGLLMTRPPRRMYDVWSDPDYDFAETKAERLLMAALDYSRERLVVYVAAKPPRSVYRSIAAHMNRRIVYIPIGQVASPKLKKLRVVHVLDSYERRKTAKDFIW